MAEHDTISLRSLTSVSSSSSSSSFVFDGTNSDIARQLLIRHQAGDTAEQVNLTSIPTAILDRLIPLNINFDGLPGLVQRAVLWDTGFAISPGNNPIQIWTMQNYTMADLAVPKSDVSFVDCTYLNCSQPSEEIAHYAQYCTGWQMLNVSRCVADDFEDPGADTYLGMMWSTGGDPNMTPSIRLRDHTWTQDIAEFGGNVTFSVYVVHTVSHELDPAWNQCPPNNGFGSLTVPCHRKIEFTDEYMAANTTVPTGSELVTTWLKNEFAMEKTQSQMWIPVLLSVIIIVAGVVLGWLGCRRKSKASMVKQISGAKGANSDSHRSLSISSSTSLPGSESLHYERAGSNKTLQILLDSEHLEGKRIPYESVVFETAISKGASGEVWVCEYNGQKAAVKRLLQRKKQKAESVQEFAKEIELTASLVHPNIVQFIGVAWNSLDNLVMLLEYLPTSLKDYLEKNKDRLSWARDKIYIAIGIARALEYLHARTPPLIHRDLKSSNVLLTDSVEPKIIDFGVSRSRVELSMTAGVGTPFWTAPEILEGNHYTEKADIYSLGVVLSELDTCEVPYHDAVSEDGTKMKPFQILKEVMSGTMRPSFSQECPARIRRITSACLSLEPSRRLTAQQLVRQLEGLDNCTDSGVEQL
ncbi:TKL/DRK protein kinase [Phytophthora nicotianae CJ01A1]|uniref:TKL/DRK protein kinase n=2 Tax=Phytophthora nicotianae TaxID=4792 RepID=W2W995_PHYNI|nr:TKL/DRK protein kinase [Phytophthora nicotianae]ETP07036.1 TKL/DRK protein kinase [Phytophthora nicotianae CJ01A1]